MVDRPNGVSVIALAPGLRGTRGSSSARSSALCCLGLRAPTSPARRSIRRARPRSIRRRPSSVAARRTWRRSRCDRRPGDAPVPHERVDDPGHRRGRHALAPGERAHGLRPAVDEHRERRQPGAGHAVRAVVARDAAQQVDRGRVEPVGDVHRAVRLDAGGQRALGHGRSYVVGLMDSHPNDMAPCQWFGAAAAGLPRSRPAFMPDPKLATVSQRESLIRGALAGRRVVVAASRRTLAAGSGSSRRPMTRRASTSSGATATASTGRTTGSATSPWGSGVRGRLRVPAHVARIAVHAGLDLRAGASRRLGDARWRATGRDAGRRATRRDHLGRCA